MPTTRIQAPYFRDEAGQKKPADALLPHHIAAWRHLGSQIDSGANIDHYIEVAQTVERGLFDQLYEYLAGA